VNIPLDKEKRPNEGIIHKRQHRKERKMDRLCYHIDEWKWRMLMNNE